MGKLLQELKRRNVFRVAGLYLVVAWLLMQVANILETALKLPDWFDGLVTALVLLGFPIALVLAWAFELTPDGVRLTAQAKDDPRPAPRSGLDIAVLLALSAVGSLIVFDRLSPRAVTAATTADCVAAADAEAARSAGATGSGENGTSDAEATSIAVLPFVDLSPDGDQEYFSDGLAEELLNVLTRLSELKVAGRTSSCAYKGKNLDLREIGRSLNVTHVLEGSVRRAGDQIRVTAQLVQAADGFHVFSETYDRKLEDIFSIQDDISNRIAKALEVRLTGAAKNQPTNGEVFDLYLHARDHIQSRQRLRLETAERELERATDLAPDYAPLYAARALVTLLLTNGSGFYGDRPLAKTMPQVKTLVDRALSLDPNLAEGHAVMGLYATTKADHTEAQRHLRHALSLNPNLTEAKLWLANVLQGPESIRLLESIVERDPGFAPGVISLAWHYANQSDRERVEALLDRAERIPGLGSEISRTRGGIDLLFGNLASAYRRLSSAALVSNTRLDREMLGWTFVYLGEFERAAREGEPTNRVIALALLNRVDESLALARTLKDHPRIASVAITALTIGQRYADAISFAESPDGSLNEDQLRAMGAYHESALPDLVVSYRKLGQPDKADFVLKEMKRAIERIRRLEYDQSARSLLYVAQYEALQGNSQQALQLLSLAVKRGLCAGNPEAPAFASLEGEEEYTRAVAAVLRRINEARAELSLPPLPA